MKKVIILSLAALSLLATLEACKGKKAGGSANANVVNARSMSDPDMLNPINLSSADGRNIAGLIFGSLLGTDPDDYHVTAVLAVARPTVAEVTEGPYKGNVSLTFEIRPEATWDNGTPITADDYIFTLKSILNPKTNCQPLKPYYEWLNDVVVDSANPKKFTVYARDKYFKIEEFAGGYVLPEYVYDPEKIMRKFPVTALNTEAKRNALKENADIMKFADQFNSEKFQREKGGVVGAGPYSFEGWVTNQTITLVRKKDWWGDKIKTRDFLALPEKIVFKVINDPNTATTALKDGQVDDYHSIEAKQYEELLKNEKVKEKIHLEHPSIFAYSFISFNLKNDKLKDHAVREAFAHCVNKTQINDVIGFGRSTPVETFVHPSQKQFNSDLKPYAYDLDLARKLLDEAGWKDSDGDGFRDKVINGEKKKLTLDFLIPSGNKGREQTGILLKEDLKKVGIELTITAKDWSVYLQAMDKKDFETTYGAFTMSSTMSDPKQLWHTSAAVTGGSNSSSFGNAKTDKLIDDLRAELDEDKRVAMYKELEQIVHDEIPCVFMFIPANRLGINKRFEVKTTLIDPGYLYNEFKAVNTNTAN
ncbi:MAG: ABC transporter substrate-binding protein [Chitinophagales bacterium]